MMLVMHMSEKRDLFIQSLGGLRGWHIVRDIQTIYFLYPVDNAQSLGKRL